MQSLVSSMKIKTKLMKKKNNNRKNESQRELICPLFCFSFFFRFVARDCVLLYELGSDESRNMVVKKKGLAFVKWSLNQVT